MDNHTICSGCLSKINGETVCPLCGNDNSVNNAPLYLKVFTMLQNKYIVGKTLYTNGEHALYIGFDVVTKTKVFVKEYIPSVLCERNENGSVSVFPGKEAQYKSMMADFYDLHKKLAACGSDIVQPINEIFGENNTVYVILPWKKFVSLRDYMDTAGEALSWEEARELFFPFLKSLSQLHAAGILHRGISPNTILLDKNCHLTLSAFATPSTRILKSDIDAQLFDGFSAPEQYSLKSWQGTWTDVYSSAAVMYYCLTNVCPPHAIERPKHDSLVPCHTINNSVPKVISQALGKALSPYTESRIQTVDSFLFALDETVYPNPKKIAPKIQERKTTAPTARPKRFPYMLVSTVATVVVLSFFGALLFRSLFRDQLDDFIAANFGPRNPEYSDSSAEDAKLLNYVGQLYDDIKNSQRLVGISLKTEYVYDENKAAGIIIEQTPSADTPMSEIQEISFRISKGSEYVTIPNILPCSKAEAIQLLADAGITDYTFIETEESGYSSGQVINCMPKVGSKIKREGGHVDILYQK